MRKKIYGVMAVLAISVSVFGGINAYDDYKVNNTSSLFLDDVVAKAQNNQKDQETSNTSTTDYKYEGGFAKTDIDVTICSKCKMEFGEGKCIWGFGCDYSVTKHYAGHRYECNEDAQNGRMTHFECSTIEAKIPPHRTTECAEYHTDN